MANRLTRLEFGTQAKGSQMDLPRVGSLLQAMVLTLAIAAPVPVMAADDPHAEATALSRQAIDLYQRGNYAEAEPLLEQALKILENVLDRDHSDVALSLNNLAELYAARGRYAEAEPLHKRALI